MYSTYIIKSGKTGKLYIGHTENLNRRLTEHNSNQSKSTKNKGPWELLYQREFGTRSDAMKHEIDLKKIKNKNYLLEMIKES